MKTFCKTIEPNIFFSNRIMASLNQIFELTKKYPILKIELNFYS